MYTLCAHSQSLASSNHPLKPQHVRMAWFVLVSWCSPSSCRQDHYPGVLRCISALFSLCHLPPLTQNHHHIHLNDEDTLLFSVTWACIFLCSEPSATSNRSQMVPFPPRNTPTAGRTELPPWLWLVKPHVIWCSPTLMTSTPSALLIGTRSHGTPLCPWVWRPFLHQGLCTCRPLSTGCPSPSIPVTPCFTRLCPSWRASSLTGTFQIVSPNILSYFVYQSSPNPKTIFGLLFITHLHSY